MTSPDSRPADPSGAADPELVGWLARAGDAGGADFRGSAVAGTLATAGAALGWVALAHTLAGVGAGPDAPWSLLAPVALAAALLVAALARHESRRRARAGRDSVAASLRARLLPTLAPSEPSAVGAGPPLPGDQAAHAAIELVDRVAGYHEHSRPARRAMGPAAGLVLLVIAVLHWPVAVLLVAATPILPLNMRLAGMAAQDASERQLTAVRALSAQLLDRFRGMRTLVTLGAVERERAVVERACAALNRATAAVLRRAFVASSVLDAVVTGSIAVCATYVGLDLLGYVRLPGTPALGFSSGLAVLVLCPVYFAPLRAHAAGYHERDEALAAARVLRELTEATGEAGVRPEAAGSPVHPGPPAVELHGVALIHADSSRPVLEGVTARAAPGTVTVLVGASGEGKTSLLRLVAGLGTPTSGSVLLRGEGAGDEARPPRPREVGWIGQRTVLVPGTVAENIGIADPDAGRPEIEWAARKAGLEPALAQLPDGLDTVLGEGGWGISAGEARRVALARALLRDASLWVLDEPTAHLDARTERALLETIRDVGAGRTVLMASHAAAPVAHSDAVWRLDRGALTVEPGGRPR